jgi:hypothetical protein
VPDRTGLCGATTGRSAYRGSLETNEVRGLIIATPWIDRILDGEKTWELRGTHTKVRGRIALIRKGSGQVVGTARLADVIGPLTLRDLQANVRKHRVPRSGAAAILERYPRPHAWVLEDARRLRHPMAYEHPRGAVIWVTLPDRRITGSRAP